MTRRPRDVDAESILRETLAGATPPASVRDRIVRGALVRAEARPRRHWIPAVVVALALGVVVFLIAGPELDEREPPVDLKVGSVHTRRDPPRSYSLGPHEVDVAAGTQLRVERLAPDDIELVFEAGRISVNVAPLALGGTFAVHAPHGEVRVVGTRFIVDASVDGCTHVTVLAGSVWLSEASAPERRLNAGQNDSMCILKATADGHEWIQEALRLIAARDDPQRAARLLQRYLETYPGGLFEEEALFHLALSLKSQGQIEQARDVAERFWAAFPDSRRGRELRQLFGLPQQ